MNNMDVSLNGPVFPPPPSSKLASTSPPASSSVREHPKLEIQEAQLTAINDEQGFAKISVGISPCGR